MIRVHVDDWPLTFQGASWREGCHTLFKVFRAAPAQVAEKKVLTFDQESLCVVTSRSLLGEPLGQRFLTQDQRTNSPVVRMLGIDYGLSREDIMR
jgi:hypothetical protein